jgi:hypothetical protein
MGLLKKAKKLAHKVAKVAVAPVKGAAAAIAHPVDALKNPSIAIKPVVQATKEATKAAIVLAKATTAPVVTVLERLPQQDPLFGKEGRKRSLPIYHKVVPKNVQGTNKRLGVGAAKYAAVPVLTIAGAVVGGAVGGAVGAAAGSAIKQAVVSKEKTGHGKISWRAEGKAAIVGAISGLVLGGADLGTGEGLVAVGTAALKQTSSNTNDLNALQKQYQAEADQTAAIQAAAAAGETVQPMAGEEGSSSAVAPAAGSSASGAIVLLVVIAVAVLAFGRK